MAKRCNRCTLLKSLEHFSVSRSNKGGYSCICKACVVLRNQEYWRTAVGRVSQIYAVQVMSSKQRKHPKPEYTRAELSAWAFENGINSLWYDWRESGYLKDLSPSIDRLDATKGYSLDNIRLVTWKDNNDKAYEDRKACRHITKQNRKVRQLTMDGNFVAEYGSISNAARETGITRININDVCRGKLHCKSAGGFRWEYLD